MTPAQQEAYVRARQKLDEENAAKERALRDAQGAAVSEQDQGWDAGKTALALGRGTGEGVAATADLPIQAGQWLWEVAKNAALEATGTPYERQAVSSPLADLYNENMPAAPAGYENVNDIAAIVGPALIETIATGGAGAPAALAQAAARQGVKGVIKTAAKGAAKAAAKTAADVGTGVVGGELGGVVGNAIGGDLGEEIGRFAGAVTGKPLAKTGLKNIKDAGLAAYRNPGYAALGAGTGVPSVVTMLKQTGLDPSLAGLMAASLPIGAGVIRGGKKLLAAPDPQLSLFPGAPTSRAAAITQALKDATPSAVGRVGSSQVFEEKDPVLRAKQKLLGLI